MTKKTKAKRPSLAARDAEDERRVEQLQRQAEERHQEKFAPYDDGETQFRKGN